MLRTPLIKQLQQVILFCKMLFFFYFEFAKKKKKKVARHSVRLDSLLVGSLSVLLPIQHCLQF